MNLTGLVFKKNRGLISPFSFLKIYPEKIMTTLKISINTDNSAFADENLGSEISRILKSYANAIESVIDPDTSWELETRLKDINGNTVGQVKLTTD